MSCNPAICGLAKGQLGREIDALGGEMGKSTDMTGLQFRMLNVKKGPSVWAPRAQCDKKAYQFRMKWICEKQQGLDVKQGQTDLLLHKDRNVAGIPTNLGVQYLGTVVVITTGTFLRRLMHIGSMQQAGGRAGEAAPTNLSDSLREVGMELGRLKTGTPPRLLRRSIDFSKTEIQLGDEPVPYFTYWKEDLFHVERCSKSTGSSSIPVPSHPVLPLLGERAGENCRPDSSATPCTRPQQDTSGMFHVEHDSLAASHYPPGSILEAAGGQIPCYITYTTDKTAEIIKANLDKS